VVGAPPARARTDGRPTAGGGRGGERAADGRAGPSARSLVARVLNRRRRRPPPPSSSSITPIARATYVDSLGLRVGFGGSGRVSKRAGALDPERSCPQADGGERARSLVALARRIKRWSSRVCVCSRVRVSWEEGHGHGVKRKPSLGGSCHGRAVSKLGQDAPASRVGWGGVGWGDCETWLTGWAGLG